MTRPRLAAAFAVLSVLVAGLFTSASGLAISHGTTDTFHLVALPFDTVGSLDDAQVVREVHPSYERISAWISSVGGAIALGDTDRDGLANDACIVDPRFDHAVVQPVPGTGDRYSPVVLTPRGIPHDERTTAPMGCLLSDLDADGTVDPVVYYWGRTPVAHLSGPDGHLASGPVVDLAPGGERWFSNAGLLADVDGDGLVDVVIGNYFPDGARVLDAEAGGKQEMQSSMSRATNGGRLHVLLRQPAAELSFHDVVVTDGGRPATGWTLALGVTDLDGDHRPELYQANDFGNDHLLRNVSSPGNVQFTRVRGERHVRTPSSKVLGRDSFKSMGVDFSDLNRDATPDIAVVNITGDFQLQESNFAFVSRPGQTGTWPTLDERSSELGIAQTGWSWDARFGDLDNDGWDELAVATGFVRGDVNRWPELQELATANDLWLRHTAAWPDLRHGADISGSTPNRLFTRHGGRFTNVAQSVGFDLRQPSRGIATGDVDGDGDLDVAVATQWDGAYLYRNDCKRCGTALDLRLTLVDGDTAVIDGLQPNDRGQRPAFGATVVVEDGGDVVGTGAVDGGSGHAGKKSQDVHIGLGARRGPLELTIRWTDRSGRRHTERMVLRPGAHTIHLQGS